MSTLTFWKMDLGWKLFDHGLNTPAEGVQKWQRALFKPFSFAKVKRRGENLSNRTILLLAEQGWDLQWYSNINQSYNQGSKAVHIIVPERLHSIYKRSLPLRGLFRQRRERNAWMKSYLTFNALLISSSIHLQNTWFFKNREFEIHANPKEQSFSRKYKQHENQIIIGIFGKVEEEKIEWRINRSI